MNMLPRLSSREKAKRAVMHVVYGPKASANATARTAASNGRDASTVTERLGQIRLGSMAGMHDTRNRPVSTSYSTTSTPRAFARMFGTGRSTSSAFVSTTAPTWTRSYSNIMEKRAALLAAQIPEEMEIDLKQIMDDMRDLELLDKLRNVTAKHSTGYKDAARALYPLWHTVDSKSKAKATFADLCTTLPGNFSLPWTAISERLVDGKVSKLAGLGTQQRAALKFMRIYNVGENRAKKFADAGARTFADLEILADKKLISLTNGQRIGLEHLDDIERLVPRTEMDALSKQLFSVIKSVDSNFECEILGSYRRGVDFSSDIDLAVRHPTFKDKDDEITAKPLMESILAKLEKKGLIRRDNQLMRGWKKYAGLIRLPGSQHFRRIDIRLSPYHSYPYMLLGGSGDALLMKLLRHTAKQKGLTLNEYGCGDKYDKADENPNGFLPGTLRIVNSEREIFELLAMPYLDPAQREYSTWRAIYAKAGIDLSYIDKL